jgi:hypothetical protein
MAILVLGPRLEVRDHPSGIGRIGIYTFTALYGWAYSDRGQPAFSLPARCPQRKLHESLELAQRSDKALDADVSSRSFNVGSNLSRSAGVKHHLHMHILPRWTGDSNSAQPLLDPWGVPSAGRLPLSCCAPLLCRCAFPSSAYTVAERTICSGFHSRRTLSHFA